MSIEQREQRPLVKFHVTHPTKKRTIIGYYTRDPAAVIEILTGRGYKVLHYDFPRGYIPPNLRFVAIRRAVMNGGECVATAKSKTFAKRIANALNHHIPNEEGV